MAGYILRRLLWLPVVLLIISALTFGLGQFAPGDPIQIMVGNRLNEETVQRLREQYGLDRPAHEQYLIFMQGVLTRFDFGESYKNRGVPVTDVVLPRLWVSIQLNFAGLVIMVPLAIMTGLIAALSRRFDRPIVTVALVLSAIPTYITGPVMFLVFARWLQWLPPSGWGGLFDARVIMPAVALAIPGIGTMARLMRASTIEVIGQDFVRTAKAKGLTQQSTVGRHILKNAMLPMTTEIGLSIAGLIGGSFFIELIFGIPGMGNLAIDAVFARDYPVIIALVLLAAAVYVVVNLAIDIAYTYLDPRIRFA